MMTTVALGFEAPILVIDVNDETLLNCREYDPVTDHLASILGFSHDHPNSLPEHVRLVAVVGEWLLQRSDDRTGFYTAQEDLSAPVPKAMQSQPAPAPPGAKKASQPKRVSNAAIAEQLMALSAQMQLLAHRQDQLEKASSSSAVAAPEPQVGLSAKLPSVSASLNPSGISQTQAAKAIQLVGPPPKVPFTPSQVPAPGVGLDEPYDPLQPVQEEVGIAAAIHQQSSAVMALVAHLTSQSGDVLGDFSSVSLQSGTTKGVQRRERMQNDLASGSSTYFIQMMQQLHRRLHPSRPVPQDESELMGISVLQYLERQGGYRSHRELGLVAWVLGHAIDAAAAGDFRHTKEVLALLLVAVEQAVIDRGDWSLAFMLTLMEEPPLQMFQERNAALIHHTRPFGPLVPPQWTAVCLSYLKGVSDQENRNSKEGFKACCTSGCCLLGCRAGPRSITQEETQISEKAEGQGLRRNLEIKQHPAAYSCLKEGPIGSMDLINDGLLTQNKNTSCMTKKGEACVPNPPFQAVDYLCFAKWCSFLAVSVLRTRSLFSRFLLSTMHLHRSSETSTSPAFPLPVPYPSIFAEMPSGLSSIKRRRCHFKRAFHVIVMALNYWWCGNSSFSLELLEEGSVS